VVCPVALLCVMTAFLIADSQTASQLAPRELAARIQARFDATRDFSADFSQSYTGGVLRVRATERGTVVIKKPGRMRWEYEEPENKLFVSDGSKMYYYVPADRQVVVSRVPAADEATTAVLFLVGKGDLARDFTAEYTTVRDAPAGTVALRLSPKQSERDYDWLSVVVDERSLAFRMLVVGDAQGGTSTFTFTKLKENSNPPDSTFTFRVPRGADVLERF
jgi:outer membrane lipoprotein carrier protein